jgi:hemerythrin-like domain-containing protein
MSIRAVQPDHALAREIEREHESVREAVRTLREEIARLRAEPGPGHLPGRLSGMLGMFRVHLARHFSLEEQGRFLGGTPGSRDPGTQRTVETLLADHRRFERDIGRLLVASQRAESGDAALTDRFVVALEEFLAELDRHEHVENELVQEIVNRDTGGGD